MHIRTEAYTHPTSDLDSMPSSFESPTPSFTMMRGSTRANSRSLLAQCIFVSDLRYFLPEYIDADGCETDSRGAKVVYTREISCYEVWAEAWDNYRLGVLLRFPDLMQDLNAYRQFIEDSSFHFSWKSVYAYDREFRENLARDPSVFTEGWGVVDVALYERCFTLPSQRFQHALSRVEVKVTCEKTCSRLPFSKEMGPRGLVEQALVGPYRPAKNGGTWGRLLVEGARAVLRGW